MDEDTAAKRQAVENLQHELSQYQRNTGADIERVHALAKELDVLSPEDLAELWERRNRVRIKRDKLQQQIVDDGLDAKRDRLTGERDELDAKIDRYNAQLESAAGAQRDLGEIDREIKGLKKQLEMLDAGASPVAAGPSEETQLSPMQRIPRMLAAGEQVARKDPALFRQRVGEMMTKVVANVLPGMFHEISVADDDSLVLIGAESREPVEAPQVHTSTWRILALACAVAGARVAAGERSFPFVWDEPAGEFDDETLQRLATVLTKASSGFQRIVLSGRISLGKATGPAVTVQ